MAAIIIVLVVFAITGVYAQDTTTNNSYTIETEDVLKIDVWGEPQLANLQVQVTPDGKINIPYLNDTQAAGKTLEELTTYIKSKLAENGIIYDAKVVVTLIKLHEPLVRVLGKVNRPGAFPFREGDTILDAIALAGSYTEDALLEKATITHKGSSNAIPVNLQAIFDGDNSQNIKLQRDDTIYIPSEDYENKVYVLGYVLKPGMYPLKKHLSVLGAISMAGGPNERGMMRNTVVVRGDRAKPERLKCDLTRLFDKADLSQDITLKSGDIVFVPETNKPDWTKLSQIFNVLFSISSIRRYGLF